MLMFIFLDCGLLVVVCVGTVTLSLRIRRDIKEKMERLRDVDWRSEIEKFIESRIREIELRSIVSEIDCVLSGVSPTGEAAWRAIREMREAR